LTREDLLAVEPAALFAGGLAQGHALRPELGAEGALALVEQLKTAEIEATWLQLAAADLAGVLRRADAEGAFLDVERARLRKRCGPAAVGSPLLSRWMLALVDATIDQLDLAAAVEFMGSALLHWGTDVSR